MRRLITLWNGTPGTPGGSANRPSAPGSAATTAKQHRRRKRSEVSPRNQVKGAYGEIRNTQPTHDQLYLASRIDAPKGRLTPAAIQKLNARYGVTAVSDALRSLRGFPPAELGSAYAYVETVCKAGQA